MMKVSIIVCVFALWAFAGVNCATPKSAAPAPSVDCSTIIFTMADCLTFVTNGSKITKPEGGCCSGLKTVLKTDAQCLCETFANSGALGISLDMKKALTLPKACGVSAPSFSNCNLPGGSPASAPKSSSPTSSTPLSPASTPEASAGGSSTSNVVTPAPAPSHAASSSSVSFVALVAILVVASSSSYSF